MSLYPIRTLAELTGVATTTLRAWERRYGLLKPERTPKGHRLYSEQDVDLIRNIVRLLNQNHSISEAVRIVRHGEDISAATPGTSIVEWTNYQALLLQHIESFNEEALDNTYNQALSMYPIDLVTEHVILPVLTALGERWAQRDTGIAEEHFFSAYLRNKLGARLHHEARRARGQHILAACMPGEHHELGLLLFCLSAISRGYRIIYLGTDMPLEQITPAVRQTRAAAVLLSASTITSSSTLKQQLSELSKALNVPLLMGGVFTTGHMSWLQEAGVIGLGEQVHVALEKLETLIPAYKR
ncbi:MAG: MerR family transcriptional regulator [Gammaproteobacteria bacterium]|nr:MAG: MerR family transcriptional regulator [Gammaproteobacteria bacterium]